MTTPPPGADADADDPRLDAVRLLARDAHTALAAAGTVEHHLTLAGLRARLRFAGPALVAPLTRAIAHLVDRVGEGDGPVDLTVTLFDSRSTGVELSPLLQALVDAAHGSPFTMLTPRHELTALDNDRLGATYELGSGVLTLYDRERREAWYWVRDPEALPYYERGAPLRTTFNWWLSGHRLQCVHAAAVGTDAGAVLLTGRGGSGKSTLALACIGTSLRYLADDYCVVANAAGPEVFSLYNTGKLRDTVDLERQPRFTDWIENPDRSGDQKYLMFIAEHAPELLQRRAPLAAVVLPQVVDDDRSSITEISPSAALRALGPTSMLQLPGSGASDFLEMSRLVRALPCFALRSGRDLAATTDLLADLLVTLTGDGPG